MMPTAMHKQPCATYSERRSSQEPIYSQVAVAPLGSSDTDSHALAALWVQVKLGARLQESGLPAELLAAVANSAPQPYAACSGCRSSWEPACYHNNNNNNNNTTPDCNHVGAIVWVQVKLGARLQESGLPAELLAAMATSRGAASAGGAAQVMLWGCCHGSKVRWQGQHLHKVMPSAWTA